MSILTVCVILVCSIIQSVFGVGLLLFGTPTFLLLGHSYENTLLLVLPASLGISFLQTRSKKISLRNNLGKSKILINIAIPTILGLLVALYLFDVSKLKFYLGILLIITVLINFNSKLHAIVLKLLKKYESPYLFIMSLIHGLMNSGGGFLSYFANNRFSKKDNARFFIAKIYLTWGFIQIILTFSKVGFEYITSMLISLVIGVSIYLLIGRKVYDLISMKNFKIIINILTLIYGIFLIK